MLRVNVGALQVTKHHSHSFFTALLGTNPEKGDGLGIAFIQVSPSQRSWEQREMVASKEVSMATPDKTQGSE